MKVNIKGYWKLLWKYLKPQWPQLVLLGVLLLLGIGLQLANPQIVRYFIDSVSDGKSLRALTVLAGCFLGVAVLQQGVGILTTYLSQNLGWVSTNALRNDLAAHCLQLDMTFHKAYRPGEIIERIDGDVTAMFNFFSKMLFELVEHIGRVSLILVLLFLEDWRIGLGMTLLIIFALLLMGKIHNLAVPRHTKVREIVTRFYGLMGEVLGSTEDIRSNGAVDKVIRRFQYMFREWLPCQLDASTISMSMWLAALAIFAVGNTLAFGLGGYLWSKGLITVGAVVMIFQYTEMLTRPLRQIQRQLVDLQKAGVSIRRVEELFQTQSRLLDGTGPALPGGAPGVQIEHLEFAYEDGVPVLRDLSLELTPGKVLGILGRTGSGKTTLARLLTRFYDPTGGQIRMSGQEIQSVPLKELRKRIAFVTQDVQLFQATVRENLTFFNPGIEDAAIWKALEEIGLVEWVRSLPNGLDTVLKSDGGGLSAGEAQLLAFVRVFLMDPGLVILDEASSRLDPVTEHLLEGAIEKLFKNRTAIIIAHRLQTVERADEIVILDQGQICEYGNRVELMKNPDSYFSRLLKQGIEEVLA